MKLKFVVCVAIFIGLAAPFTAIALPLNSVSRTYFDINGHIVGQQIRYCSGQAEHAGVVDESNPFYVEEIMGCAHPTVTCTETVHLPTSPGSEATLSISCSPPNVSNESMVSHFSAPAGLGLTQTAWCSGTAGLAWGLHAQCGYPAPARNIYALPDNLWTFGFGNQM